MKNWNEILTSVEGKLEQFSWHVRLTNRFSHAKHNREEDRKLNYYAKPIIKLHYGTDD